MDLIIIRHGRAGQRDAQRWPDDGERPLTSNGERRFRRTVVALRRLLGEVDMLASSPLRRAWQTAEILQQEASWPAPQAVDALAPGSDPAALVPFLRRRPAGKRIAVVGHEPHLHELVGLLVGGPDGNAGIEMKKGGAACVRFSGAPGPGKGILLWLLPPRAILGAKRPASRG
jgi:phosphohistidine phosphatase